jgi:hypothetical protein
MSAVCKAAIGEMKPARIDGDDVAAKGQSSAAAACSHIEGQKDQQGRDIARQIDPARG